MTEPKSPSDQLHAFIEALAEDEATLSDEQILADAAAGGTDVKAEAENVRNVLLGAVRKHRRARLDAAEEEHRRELARIAAASARLPRTPEARRARLQRAIERAPQLRESLTLSVLHSICEHVDEVFGGES